MIKINELQIEINSFNLKSQDISLAKGEKVLLLASNNAGKSIFLLGLLGLIKTKARDIYFKGLHCERMEWQDRTGVYLDQSSLVPFLTPIEFFEMTGKLKGLSKIAITQESAKYADYLRLPKDGEKHINQLSLGTQKKVGIVATLLGNPEILFWDEPFANLDEESAKALASIIANELNETLILLTSPTEELPYKSFDSRLTIDNGWVKFKI
jgi:ABC-2 type transport system ATP-binding protein